MKPNSTSTKDWILASVAKELGVDETICDRVISWSYEQLKEATKVVSSVEISGFGKLLVADKKLNRRLANRQESLENHMSKSEEVKNYKKIEKLKEEINFLKSKVEHSKSSGSVNKTK